MNPRIACIKMITGNGISLRLRFATAAGAQTKAAVSAINIPDSLLLKSFFSSPSLLSSSFFAYEAIVPTIAKQISMPKSSSGISGSLSQIRATKAIQKGLVWKTTMTMETGANVTPQLRRKKSVWPNRLRTTRVHFFYFQGNIFTGL